MTRLAFRAALALASVAGSAAELVRREATEFFEKNPGVSKVPGAIKRRWETFARVHRFETGRFCKRYPSGRSRWFLRPHSPHQPRFIAIVRTADGKKYHGCKSYEQALAHKPYVIEHVNGFGQVMYRENLERLARARAILATVSLVLEDSPQW